MFNTNRSTVQPGETQQPDALNAENRYSSGRYNAQGGIKEVAQSMEFSKMGGSNPGMGGTTGFLSQSIALKTPGSGQQPGLSTGLGS